MCVSVDDVGAEKENAAEGEGRGKKRFGLR